MFVISRNTAFTYRNKSVETRKIGRELRVRYVLKGPLRHLLWGRRHQRLWSVERLQAGFEDLADKADPAYHRASASLRRR
jgi:hypothetical protein